MTTNDINWLIVRQHKKETLGGWGGLWNSCSRCRTSIGRSNSMACIRLANQMHNGRAISWCGRLDNLLIWLTYSLQWHHRHNSKTKTAKVSKQQRKWQMSHTVRLLYIQHFNIILLHSRIQLFLHYLQQASSTGRSKCVWEGNRTQWKGKLHTWKKFLSK